MSGNGDHRPRRGLRPIPRLDTDEAAERFVTQADLTRYDLSGFRRVHFEFAPKNARITVRLPEALLEEIRREASARGLPYQRFLRDLLERGLEAVHRERLERRADG